MFKINDWISQDSKVLDLGCGDGSLLNDLRKEKSASGLGIEIDAEKIKSCLKKGISVIEQDIDSGLENFSNQSFDYVVMSQSIQALKKPEVALEEIVRIGKECIVSFPNFANQIRIFLYLKMVIYDFQAFLIGSIFSKIIFRSWTILFLPKAINLRVSSYIFVWASAVLRPITSCFASLGRSSRKYSESSNFNFFLFATSFVSSMVFCFSFKDTF